MRQKVNRTLSKKVNRARGEPVKHCGEPRKEEREQGRTRSTQGTLEHQGWERWGGQPSLEMTLPEL